MPGSLMDVQGVEATSRLLSELKTSIPRELAVGMDEAMTPVQNEVVNYPGSRTPTNPRSVYVRGRGTEYTREDGSKKLYATSERYGATTTKGVKREGPDIVGYVNSPASYAELLRGTLEPGSERYDKPAWMHRGIWKTLKTIRDELLPSITRRLNKRIQDLIARLDR